MRYRLRTLLIVLAVGPMLGALCFREIERAIEERRRQDALSKLGKAAYLRYSFEVTYPDEPPIGGPPTEEEWEAMKRNRQTVSPLP